MPKRSKSSSRWLERQRRDPFAKQAAGEGNLSRAYYKLEQLDKRFKLLAPKTGILELGAAPGGWTAYLEEKSPDGLRIAVDTRPIQAMGDTQIIEGEYGTDAVDESLVGLLGNVRLDLVLSDMAPNMSGIKVADQARCMDLAELTEEAALRWLKPGGQMLDKVFHGSGLDTWRTGLRAHFTKVSSAKPAASRPDSREHYVLATGFKGQN